MAIVPTYLFGNRLVDGLNPSQIVRRQSRVIEPHPAALLGPYAARPGERGETLYPPEAFAELVTRLECAPVSLTRGGRASLPEPSTRLETGDLLQIGADLGGATALRTRLYGESAASERDSLP